MAKQSRRYQSRKTPLHLETFERRNLLSGTHVHSWLPLSAPAIGPAKEEIALIPATLHQAMDHDHGKHAPAIGPTLEALLQLDFSGKGGAVHDSKALKSLDQLF